MTKLKHSSTPRRIKVGLAGLGRSGWDIHAQYIAGLPDYFELAGVHDPDLIRMRDACAKTGSTGFRTLDALLAAPDIELVVVATPSHLHGRHALQALRAGKHVICEKPLVATSAEVKKLITAARRARRQLLPFQNKRYDKDFLEVKRIIESGLIGRPTFIRIAYHGFGRRWDWQTLKRFNGGSLANTGPHPIDQALVLFGAQTPQVACDLRRTLTFGDAEDHVKVILSAERSPTIEIEIMASNPWPAPRWLVMGTRGGIVGGPERLDYKYFDPSGLPKRRVDPKPSPDRSYNSEQYPWVEKTWLASADNSPGAIQFYRDVFASLREKRRMPVTPDQVFRQIRVIEQCHKMSPLYRS